MGVEVEVLHEGVNALGIRKKPGARWSVAHRSKGRGRVGAYTKLHVVLVVSSIPPAAGCVAGKYPLSRHMESDYVLLTLHRFPQVPTYRPAQMEG